MRPRISFIGALVALFALTAYFAEGVWASVCAPGMQMASDQPAAEHAGDCPACPVEMAHGAAHDTAPEQAPADAPPCPLGPAGASGSCAAVSLPAAILQIAPFSPEGALLSSHPDASRDLLLVGAFFHPPRA